MNALIVLLVTLMAAAANLLTAVMVPLVYVMHMDRVMLGAHTFSFVMWGWIPYAAYVLLNFASGKADQGQNRPWRYWLDTGTSVIAFLSINVSAAIVMFGLFSSNQDVIRVISQDSALLLLVFLVVFSWMDILWLQGAKRAMLVETLQNPAGPAPSLATYVAANPASSNTGAIVGSIAATLLVLLLVGAALQAWSGGIRFPSIARAGNAAANANAASAPCRWEPNGTNRDGIPQMKPIFTGC